MPVRKMDVPRSRNGNLARLWRVELVCADVRLPAAGGPVDVVADLGQRERVVDRIDGSRGETQVAFSRGGKGRGEVALEVTVEERADLRLNPDGRAGDQ